MFHCPKCHYAAHARTSRYFSDTTKERYHQCTNINCSCTYVTTETVERFIVSPGVVVPAAPASDAIRAATNHVDLTKRKPRKCGVFYIGSLELRNLSFMNTDIMLGVQIWFYEYHEPRYLLIASIAKGAALSRPASRTRMPALPSQV